MSHAHTNTDETTDVANQSDLDDSCGKGSRTIDAATKRIARSSGWLLSAQLGRGLLLLIQSVVLTRSLGVESFGVLVLVIAYVLTVLQLFDSRVFEALTRYVPHFLVRGEQRHASGTILYCVSLDVLSSFVAIMAIFFTANFAAELLLGRPASAGLIILFSAVCLFKGPSESMSAVLRLFEWSRHLAIQQVSIAGLQTVGLLLVCLLSPKIENVIIVYVAVSAVSLVSLSTLAFRVAKERGVAVNDYRSPLVLKGYFSKITRFAFFSNLTATSRLITAKMDTLVLGAMASPATAGIYEIGKQGVSQLISLSNPLYQSIYPEFSNLVADGKLQALDKLKRRLTRSIAPIVFVVCLLGTALAPPVIPWVFGMEFADSVPVVQVLVWQLSWLPLIWVPGYLLALNRVGMVTTLSWADAIVFCGLLLLFVPQFGALGAALAATARVVVWSAAALLIIKRVSRQSIDASSDLPSKVSTCLMD